MRTTIAADRKPGICGHRVLLEDAEPFSELDMLGPGNIMAVLRKYGSLPLEEACGALDSFVGVHYGPIAIRKG
ncbi:hypothetical protein [Rhizobium fabae]|uniref:Uncharacterized protein n=1 Tax=Rhizobium fabae TaxID=573179 RepID=A0A7W6FKJ1_9HYPH|nr:hypothetical protein [Rhizobium fabae]MBB3917195.1 hypothetical protein [Rhizobium fabae]